MSLAGLGAFAGGVAGGIDQGNRLVNSKQARDDVRQRMAERAKATQNNDSFAVALKALMSSNQAEVDAGRMMLGHEAKTVTPGGTGNVVPSAVAPGQTTLQRDMPQAPVSPYAGAGLGTL